MGEPAALTQEEAAGLRARMCGGKVAYDYDGASRAAWRLRHIDGEAVNAYPCPFHGHHVWHVGHPPSIERMVVLARFLRFGATSNAPRPEGSGGVGPA